MPRIKPKEHLITIRVRFDKPVSHAAALRFCKKYIRGQEYDSTIDEENLDGWQVAKVK